MMMNENAALNLENNMFSTLIHDDLNFTEESDEEFMEEVLEHLDEEECV